MLVLRVGTGLMIGAHGVNHANGRQRTTAWSESIGFCNAELRRFASTSTELAIGAALIVGLPTGPATAGLVAVMVIAYWSVHRHNGFFIFRSTEGWEYVATLAMIGTAIAVAWPGAASIDKPSVSLRSRSVQSARCWS